MECDGHNFMFYQILHEAHLKMVVSKGHFTLELEGM